jgi:two-component system phosphate regulon sensor histidine kinase PhoR
MSLEHISNLIQALLVRLIGLSALIMLLSLALSAVFSHLLSTPIRALSRAALRVAGGDFSVRVPPSSNDEIRDLTDGFNSMAGRLENSFAELKARKEELEGIISSITELLLVLDTQGRVLMFNDAAREIITSDTVQGRFYWELLRSPKLNALMDASASGPASGDVELAGRIYLCSINPLASRTAKVLMLHDITEMKRLEQIKRDLAVNVSHELRTPLTAIKGFTETLLEEAQQGQEEYLRIILRHTERLIAMVNDLLVLSEMEDNPRFDREQVAMGDIIANVLTVYEPRIRAKGLELTVDCPPVTIMADAFRLEQLLTNLVDNALKYTEKGSISLSTERKGDTAVITVKDTGMGIAREHLHRIFERFYVADKSRSRSLGGTGLGLAIAKHIASLHGGRIEVESTPYRGTTFRVVLPASS